MAKAWKGVDLDRTLAFYDRFRGAGHIGEPIPAMLARVRRWLAAGENVKLVTARANGSSPGRDEFMAAWVRWSQKHLGMILPVTASKDLHMTELWDDLAVGVVPNTGGRADGLED